MREEFLLRRAEELAKRRPEYIKAKRFLATQDDLLQQIMALSKKFQPGDGGEKAIYVISRLHALLEPCQEAINTVKAFETSERNYQKVRNSLPKETPEGFQEPSE